MGILIPVNPRLINEMIKFNSPQAVLAGIFGLLSISAIALTLTPAAYRDCGEADSKKIKCKIQDCANGICRVDLTIKGDPVARIEIDCKNNQMRLEGEGGFTDIPKGSYIERERGIACNRLFNLDKASENQ